MKNTIRVVILLAIFGLFTTAIQSCDKQEEQSTDQVVKKSGDQIEMTMEEYIERLDIVEVFESPNSCIEGVTSSGAYVIVSIGDYSTTPPDYLPEGHNGPHLCCFQSTVCNGEVVHTCCWAYDCTYCHCLENIILTGPLHCE